MRYTHTGYVVGCDARTRDDYRRKVLLRETKTMWISKDGGKYSKKHYGRTPGMWPMYKLDTESIRLIP